PVISSPFLGANVLLDQRLRLAHLRAPPGPARQLATPRPPALPIPHPMAANPPPAKQPHRPQARLPPQPQVHPGPLALRAVEVPAIVWVPMEKETSGIAPASPSKP